MTLTEFLNLLIPEGGFRFVQYGVKDPKGTRAAKTNEALADIIEELDATGTQVWFSPVRYREREVVVDDKSKQRCQENAELLQSLWLDIDAGPDKVAKGTGYANQQDALEALDSFCEAYGLPEPLRLSSGGGIHCYWPLTKALRVQTWVKLATILKKIAKEHGLLADSSRTCDYSSLMRPITATNLKNPDYPRKVKVLALHEAVFEPTTIGNLLLPHAGKAPAAGLGAPPKHLATDINEDLALPVGDYPDVDADTLADNCAQIRFFRDTGSDEYNHWFKSIGTVKHCLNGDAKCHEWSSKAAAYTHKETQFKIDEWKTGPATCAAFEDYNGLCAGCAYSGKIASPIRLGFVNKTTVEIVEEDAVLDEAGTDDAEVAKTIIELPEPFSISNEGDKLQVTIKKPVKPPKGSPPGTPPTFEENTYPWCNIFFYPADRIEDEQGEMQQRFRVKVRGRWKEFTLPTSLIGTGGTELRRELSKYEIVVRGAHRQIMEDYVVAFTDQLRKMRESIQSYRTFGWQKDGTFVTGDRVYTQEGVRSVVLGGNNALMFSKHLCPKGTVDTWIELVDRAYNHPGHEQFHFVLYAGFGSVLAKALGMGSSVLSLYGGAGKGKTTVAKVALSIFGDPEHMSYTWKSGSTFKACVVTASVLNSLPYLLDEFSNADPKQLSEAAYAFANSNARTGVRPDQTLVKGGENWANTTFFTTNTPLHDILSSHKEDASAEISRIIEMPWTAKSAIEKNEMLDIYPAIVANGGSAGAIFLKYVVANQETCRALTMKIMERIDKQVGFSQEYRYWSQIIAAALAAGYIATKLRLLKFNFKAVETYAAELGKSHMARIPKSVSTPVDAFHAMLTAFSQQIISTPGEVGPHGTLYETKVVGAPVGRVLMDLGEAYLAVNSVKEWCTKRCIGYDRIRESLESAGILVNADAKYYLGKGTKLPTGQMRCWKIDWSKITTNHNTPNLQLVI